MVHWRYFITRRPDLSRDEFFTYWRKRPRAVAEPIPQIKRYIQSHGLLDPPGDSITLTNFASGNTFPP